MASCLQLLRDKRRKNGGLSNVNCPDTDDDPECLMEEFCCLYSEKLRAIDKEYPDSLEPKCQALTELVSDLTEQNYMLLKAVEDLEKEALRRVEAFGTLAEAAKDTIQQDTVRRGIEENKSQELECKVKELQEALKENEIHLSSCMVEVERLTNLLGEKYTEPDQSKSTSDRMSELQTKLSSLEKNLKDKSEITRNLQIENEKLKADLSKPASDSKGELQYNNSNMEKALKDKSETIKSLQMENEKLKADLSKPASDRMGELHTKLSSLEKNLKDKSETTRSLQIENEKLKADLSKPASDRMGELQNKVSILEKSLKDKSETTKSLQMENEKLKADLKPANDRMGELQNKVSILEKNLKDKSETTKILQMENEKLKADLSNPASDRMGELQNNVSFLENKFKVKSEPTNSLEMENDKLKADLSKPSSDRIGELQNKVSILEKNLKDKSETTKNLQMENEKLKADLSKPASDRMGELQRKVSIMEKNLKDRSETTKNLKMENEKLKANLSKPASDRMDELQCKLSILEKNLKEKCETIECLQKENDKLKSESSSADLRMQEATCQLEILKEELQQKNCVMEKLKCEMYSPSELECLESNYLNSILALKEDLIEQLIEGDKDTRLALLTNSRICELTTNNKWLECKLDEKETLLNKTIEERDVLQLENEQVSVCIATQTKKLDELTKEIEFLKCEITENEMEVRNCSCFMQNELGETKYSLCHEHDRLKQYEEQISYLENTLLNVQNSVVGENSRLAVLNREVECLQQEVEKKNCEIVNHKSQEENLKYEISRMKTYMASLERQCKEKAAYFGCEIEKKDALLQKYEKQFENMNFYAFQDQKSSHKDSTTSRETNLTNIENDDNSDLKKLRFKLKDVQEALTGEIADKHDEIRRLKDDVKELEEKLLHSDKQTQFKDDIIKELRKEVKIGRAKESLAEMLGLKGTPRAAMKTRIDHLTGQLEEMRTHVLSLEERLAECNLPAVISLRSRLNNAEGSLLAMCNKMDYVRRYLENLKGDEELSIKCGLEALLSELREDVEWNRQTRRNLSLDEGTSVIVISHRSHSLPDNSLHRLVSKTKSDPAVTLNKQAALHSQHSLESFQECRNYIQVINELESDFEETRKAVCCLWHGFQSYTKELGDHMLNDMDNVLLSFDDSKKVLIDLIEQMESSEYYKGNTDVICYNLHCLKTNIMDISNSLSKANMISSTSNVDLILEAGDPGVRKKISTAINDSLSIIEVLESLKKSIMSEDKDSKRCIVETNLSEAINLIKSLLKEKEKFFEKLAGIQKQQHEFSQTLINKIMEFEKGFSSYNTSAESLKKETRKLFAIILAKEKQIQKQFDEIDDLKMALSSNKYVEEASEEIDSLRKVVSNKDLQLVEKQELIKNLRSLNHSLRRRQLSQSSPSLSITTDSSDHVMDKTHQLEEGILTIKEKFTAMSSYLLNSKEKMVKFEIETKRLVQALQRVHHDITTAKESLSKNPAESYISETNFTEAEFKVEELLQALEVFIFDERPDYKEFTESINSHIEMILEIIEFIKRSYESERVLMKSLTDENKEMKLQLNKLENRLTVASSQQTEINESQALVSEECETEDVGVYTKDEFIQSLQEDLCRSNSYLEKMQEEYTSLKLEKAEMEDRNQKVMEELQAKVCKLQAALQSQAPEAVSSKSWIFSWPQNRQIRHVHDV